MSAKTKKKVTLSFDKLEKNFQALLNNKEIQKVVSNIKKAKKQRQTQIEKMVNSTVADVRKSFQKEKKALVSLYDKELKKTKKVFDDQIAELEKIKFAVEEHIKLQARLSKKKKAPAKKKKATKKKATKKKATKKKVAKKTTKKKATRKKA